MSFADIVRRSEELVGADFANTYVLTNYAETVVDEAGRRYFPRRFVVARFLVRSDRHRPHPDRRQEILGNGASWAEAFARAEIKLRGGAGGAQ
jgi:hypothetical protein